MKLLFDQNLSPHLVRLLAKEFPHSAHVYDIGLDAMDDGEIWRFAISAGFVIVSKDTDFRQRSFVYGHPPKVIWLKRGKAGTDEVAAALRNRAHQLVAFENDPRTSFVILE